jgi:hypothetical protein
LGKLQNLILPFLEYPRVTYCDFMIAVCLLCIKGQSPVGATEELLIGHLFTMPQLFPEAAHCKMRLEKCNLHWPWITKATSRKQQFNVSILTVCGHAKRKAFPRRANSNRECFFLSIINIYPTNKYHIKL